MNYKVQRLLVIGLLVLLVALAYLVVSSVLGGSTTEVRQPYKLEAVGATPTRPTNAPVVESADTTDLKSVPEKGAGSSPARGTRISVIYALDSPTMPVSRGLIPVIGCESGWNPEAVGSQGERGLLQIHPVHLQELAEQKLDFTSEHDRLVFAEQLYQARGLRDWESSSSCWRK